VIRSASFIVVLLFAPVNISHVLVPNVSAQTNAAMLADPSLTTNGKVPNILAPASGGLEIKKGVKYFDNASGYLVYPSTNLSSTTPATKKLPAVIMIHEFWGINDNIRSMANTLASQAGYVVLAVDLFKDNQLMAQI
jgi:hypothetical protein